MRKLKSQNVLLKKKHLLSKMNPKNKIEGGVHFLIALTHLFRHATSTGGIFFPFSTNLAHFTSNSLNSASILPSIQKIL